ncbi:MAG: hypothetical protein KA419_21035 [Acidobacteria bacterium]|nr:hypothetical protein [Acidobacteriota bacterium]
MNSRRVFTSIAGLALVSLFLVLAGCAKAPGGDGAQTVTGSAQPVSGTPGFEGQPAAGGPVAGPGAEGQPPAGEALPPPPHTFTWGAGSTFEVKLASGLSTKANKSGQPFSAELALPLEDGDWVVAEKGAAVSGTIVESNPGGRVKGVAFLVLTLNRLTLADGRTVDLKTDSFTQKARTTHGKDAAKIGVGAGAGAVIGGIAGGGKGAAVGALVGGGAGTGVVLATRGDPATLAAGARLTFRLAEPVTITRQ